MKSGNNLLNKNAIIHVIDNDESVRASYALLLSAYNYIVYCVDLHPKLIHLA